MNVNAQNLIQQANLNKETALISEVFELITGKAEEHVVLECLEQAAEAGDIEAQYSLGRIHLMLSKPINERLFNELCSSHLCDMANRGLLCKTIDELVAWFCITYCSNMSTTYNQAIAYNWLVKAVKHKHQESFELLMLISRYGFDLSAVDLEITGEIAEQCFQRAVACFDNDEPDYERGMDYLSAAIKFDHLEAKQRWENAFLKFAFIRFVDRSDSEMCYEYAFKWLEKAHNENPMAEDAIFGLAVLYAFGKGVNLDSDKAYEFFKRFCSGENIQEYEPNNPKELNAFATTFVDKQDGHSYLGYYFYQYVAKFLTTDFQGCGFVLFPALYLDFYRENEEFDELKDFVNLIERDNRIFEQESTKKSFIKTIIELNNKIVEKKALENKMQKLVEQFTHTLGNVIFPDTIYQVAERLKTNPECRKDVLLLNEAYHSEIIIKLQAELLRQRYANANPENFLQRIRKCRRKPDGGDKTKSIVDILDYAASRVTARFLNQHNASLESIRTKILTPKNVSLDCLRQKFEDDILLNKTQSSVEWINQNLRPFKVIEASPIWQKVCILSESHAEALLFGYFSEILFNAFKYADHTADEFLTVVFDEAEIEGKTYLTCNWCNPLGDNVPNSLGTGKGLEAIQEDLKQLNENDINSLKVVQNNDQFNLMMFFKKDLLIDEIVIPDCKRKIKTV